MLQIPLYLDLASIDSIKTFANIVLNDFPRVHALINNAGISMPTTEKRETEDGFEMHFQVNYLGHFILTQLLIDRLKESSPSRLVYYCGTWHLIYLRVKTLCNIKSRPSRNHVDRYFEKFLRKIINFKKQFEKQ